MPRLPTLAPLRPIARPITRPITRPVARLVRTILSGQDDGQPPWVRALGRDGDAGWSGPGSELWQVHGSLATLVGGIRALLLQAAHPLALAGVEQHSDYRSDPLGRLQRTSLFITTTTYGSSEQAAATVRAVLRVHERVVGTAADGRPYAANDPRLLLWVHVALTDSMLAAYDAFGRSPLSGRGAAGAPFDGDGYVAEMAVIAERLGVPEPPRSRATLAATLEAFRPELSGDAATREVVGFLANPPLPAAARPAYALLHRGALGLLPAWVHPILGTRRSPWPVQVADGVGTAAALAGLRLVLGDRSPGERAALARIERWTAAGHSPFPVIMHNLADHAPTERSSLS